MNAQEVVATALSTTVGRRMAPLRDEIAGLIRAADHVLDALVTAGYLDRCEGCQQVSAVGWSDCDCLFHDGRRRQVDDIDSMGYL